MHPAAEFYSAKLALYLAVAASAIEAAANGTPVEAHYIFGWSAALAALGGFASALRESRATGKIQRLVVVSSIINMAALGASVSMFSLWMLNGEATQSNAIGIIGLCGILGLAGEPLLTPLVSFIYDVANRFLPDKKQ